MGMLLMAEEIYGKPNGSSHACCVMLGSNDDDDGDVRRHL